MPEQTPTTPANLTPEALGEVFLDSLSAANEDLDEILGMLPQATPAVASRRWLASAAAFNAAEETVTAATACVTAYIDAVQRGVGKVELDALANEAVEALAATMLPFLNAVEVVKNAVETIS